MAHPLSQKQMRVLKALEAFSKRHGYIPSVRELAGKLKKSPTTVFQHLKALERRGYIRSDGSAHGWHLVASSESYPTAVPAGAGGAAAAPAPERVVSLDHEREAQEAPVIQDDRDGWVRVPFAGTIAAGRPLEAVEDASDTLMLPGEMAPPGAFALRVQGDSMIEDHILDGDVVIVRPEQTVTDGEIAVAVLDDGSATLKRVYREKTGIRLQPANSEMSPIYAESVRIQGRVVGVWRTCS